MNSTKKSCSSNQDQTLEMIDEDDEDILSLCDLPINCKNKPTSPRLDHDQKISSSPLKSSSPRENQENLFEFFSEEWNVVDTATSPKITISNPVIPLPFPPPDQAHDADDDDDLIFRPKNISNSNPPNPRTKNTVVLPRVLTYPLHKRSKSTRMAPSKLPNRPMITKSKSYSSATSSKSVEDQSKVSASPAKSKLLLVLFGLPPKIPTGQTMADIKIRQSRHAPSTFIPSNSSGGGCRDDPDAATDNRSGNENRMWRFVKAVTCFRSQHPEKLAFDV